MTEAPAPEHMDRHSRNERLYRTLLGMGLVVDPIRANDDPTKMEGMYVSAELPAVGQRVAEVPAKDGVRLVMERALVGQVARSPEGARDAVIQFPTKV